MPRTGVPCRERIPSTCTADMKTRQVRLRPCSDCGIHCDERPGLCRAALSQVQRDAWGGVCGCGGDAAWKPGLEGARYPLEKGSRGGARWVDAHGRTSRACETRRGGEIRRGGETRDPEGAPSCSSFGCVEWRARRTAGRVCEHRQGAPHAKARSAPSVTLDTPDGPVTFTLTNAI